MKKFIMTSLLAGACLLGSTSALTLQIVNPFAEEYNLVTLSYLTGEHTTLASIAPEKTRTLEVNEDTYACCSFYLVKADMGITQYTKPFFYRHLARALEKTGGDVLNIRPSTQNPGLFRILEDESIQK